MNRILVSAVAVLSLSLSAPVFAEGGNAATPAAEAGEPTREELKSVDASLETVRAVCSGVLDVLLAELRTRYPDIVARRSGGRSQKNDYRNYQWISVKFGEREYMLATHHGNLDARTGNPHTQFGRIQFWRCAGPNGPHTRDADGVWRFRADNEDRSLPATRVWDEGYSSAAVVDRFVAFLEACGEGEPLAALAAERDDAEAGKIKNGIHDIHAIHGPKIADPPLADRRRADEALENVRAVEAKTMAAIVAELRRRHPEWKVRTSHGNSRANDYRCYQWITVRVAEDDVRWISMVFNDQDPATGNTHSQFGRIQFWRGIDHHNGPRNEAGPHTRDAGGWRFRSDRQWADMPRLHLWSPDYSSARVADLFEAFLRAVP